MSEFYSLKGYVGSYEPGASMSDRPKVAVTMYWNEFLNFHGLQNPQMTPDLPESSRIDNRHHADIGSMLNVCIRTLSTDVRVASLIRNYFEILVPNYNWYRLDFYRK